ncbi:MAG: nucleoside triphosphate pyrophosphohydrolase [Cyanobacteria bacterium]|nr:nucleoside triphosphate pyrophosphohydrolase [Cyanobacteriota bacterium]
MTITDPIQPSISPSLGTHPPLTETARLLAVVSQLRDPKTGCPWDLKQTHASLRPYVLEEAYEVIDTIAPEGETQNYTALAEELGDLLLQVTLHAQLASEEKDPAKHFDFESVAGGIADKLIRRHPHVFQAPNAAIVSPEQVSAQWEQIKQAEKETKNTGTGIASTGKGLPALSRALKVSQKAVSYGFEWPNFESLWQCVMSEYAEFQAEIPEAVPAKLEEEMGDILFATVNLARHFKIHPEVALNQAIQKFTQRFETMEALLPEKHPGLTLEQLSFEDWDTLWNQAKRVTTTTPQ